MTKYARGRDTTFLPQGSSSTEETLHMSYMHVGLMHRGRHTDGQTNLYICTDRQTDRHTDTLHIVPVWCLSLRKVAGDEGGLEPPAMLIRPLEIKIRRTTMVWGGVWAATVLASIVKHSHVIAQHSSSIAQHIYSMHILHNTSLQYCTT